MKTRKRLIPVVALIMAMTAACAPPDEEPQDQPVQEVPVEIDPESLSGSLSQDESVAFSEFATEKSNLDICEFIGADLNPDDINGYINLLMDLGGGNRQGIERINQMGVSIHAREVCDY